MPGTKSLTNQAWGQNTNPQKKEYTADEILKNFIAVNEELKQKGYTYYQLPSMQVSQIWLDGKLTTYYPDLPNIVYPSTEGPKGSITDYKNPNFDEALLRKYTDAKSLSDQYQDRVSREVRSAIANASDPSKVSVATVTAQVNSSIDRIGGGRGITLNPNNPQYNASSLKISNELRRANAPSNKYGAPLSINTDSLSIEAVRNNDADNIVALRKVWGAQPAPADTGLDPRSDEYQYLSYKQGENYKERNSAGAYKSKTLAATVAEKEAALKTAWADFKAVNDELKAKGYSYYEVSDGVYGTVIARNDSKFYVESLKKIDGPKGSLNTLYSRYPDGRYFNPIADPNSPQFDKSLSDLNIKANQKGSPGLIVGSSGLVTSFQSLKDAEDRLLAKGVDLVKLEQDNPYSVGTADNDQLVTFGAKAPTGQTNLEKASEIANQQNNNLLSGANNNTGPNNPSAVSSPSTVAENEAALKTAWANFKSVNDELKAKGYSYQEAKDGMYGTAVGLTVPNNDIFKNVEGPKGNIRSVSSVDESLNDLYIRARTGSKALWPASASLAQAQSFQEIQDNPAGILAGTNNQVATFGAVPAIDQTNLERASELANQNSVMPLSAGNNTAPDYGTDEYKYLQALQESQHVGFSSPKIEDTTAGLAGAWSQFKSDNEKLKAEGYDYQEVKPGFYGKPVVSTDSFLTRVSGPNGDIVSATGSLSSELKDIRVRAKGPATLYDASQQFSADQKVDELSKVLIAKGVDVAKLEQDNSFAAGAGNNSGLGLNPASDEFKYLFAKKTVDLMNRDAYGAKLGDPKTELDKAWANFKAVNDELKAKGYNYNEAKEGAYGTVIKFNEKTSPKSDWPLKTINGPNGNIGELGVYKPGTMEFADPRMDVNSAQYDKALADLYKKSTASNTYLGRQLGLASNTLLASEELKTIADGLIARGVDLVKLEQDNPNFQLSSVAMSPSQLEDYNAWANSPAGRTTLERASEIANQQNNSGLGLNPASDEFKYLFTKKKVDLMNRDAYGAKLGDPKTELDKAWANFKAVNDELKAKGYNYNEAKEGAYGTVIKFNEKTSPKSDWPLKTINGPNGNIGELGVYKPGTMEFADPRMDVNSAQYDKALADLHKKSTASNTYLGRQLGLASNTLLASEELKTIADGLIARGVDLVKLEQDNPNFQLSSVAMSPSQLEDYNAWANSPAGRTTLERASEIANQQNNNLLSGANNNTGPNSPSAVSSPSTVAENEAALKTAWADFKSVNDELKAKGYSYQEAKDGMYGTAVGLTVSNNDIFNNVEGPKGLVRDAARVDESLNDLYFRARTGSKALWPASASLAQAQSFQEIQDNPAGILAGTNNQVATFGAVPITGQATLGQAPGLAGNPTTGPVYTPGTTGAGNNSAPDYGTDEYKYLQALQESQHVGFSSPKIEDTTTGLAGAWAQFKADNEKLKAEGYDYQEVKPGFYGKPVVSTDSFLTRVSGPKGDIVSATGSLSSELKDIRVRAKGPATLYDASQQFSADQKVDELSKVLIAKGVDVAKLEQDNSFAAGAGNNTGLGLDPATDEFKYLFAKKTVDLMNRDPYGTQLGDPKTELDKAWANFKAVNDELKAKGYTYIEAKDGAYGTVLKFDEKTTPKSDSPYKPTINGPNGTIDELGAYKPGTMEFADPRMDVNSAQYDKALADLYKKSTASNTYLGGQLGLASNTLLASEELKTIADRLIAKGVDLVKLEQDNPQGMLAGTMDNPVVTFGANAAKNVLGVPDRQRGGGAGGNLMQTNATNQQQIYDPMALAQQQIAASIASGKDKLDAQNKAIAAGTWKPSDGYYFTTNYAPPYSIAFDPTGKMKDYVPVGDNDWLKAHGYTYVTADGALVFGPKGNMPGFETDQSKKGEAQLINEQKWAELGVSLSGMPDLYGNPKYGSDVENMTWSQQATKIISDPINNPKNKPGLVDTSWLKPNGLTLEQAQIKAAALVNPVDGKPKPGVTQEMIAQAAKDVIISSGKLKVVNGMIVNTTNLITSDPMQSDMLPSPEWLKKMGYVVGTGGVDDVLGADGKMYSVQFPTEIAKAKNQPAATAAQTAAAAAIAGNTPAPIDRKKENELKAIWQTAINSASDIDSSTGAAEIAKRNQAMLTAESNYKNELARNDGLFQSAMVTAQNALLPAGGAVVNPSTNQALAVPTPTAQVQPANPDYNPALVHPTLNPTGSIQKQMELNAFFQSPNPDIQASLISELNPTGSLKKQADLNNYFASLPKTAPATPSAASTYSATLPQSGLTRTTDKTGNSTMTRPSTIASTTSTQPASWSPYNAPVAASGIIATDQNLAPATITLTDKNGVSRTVAINSPEAIHVGGGGTYQDLDTISAIYSKGTAEDIANWEKFSGSKPLAGGYTTPGSADPYTPTQIVTFNPPKI